MKKLIFLFILLTVYFLSFGQNESLENKRKVIVQIYGSFALNNNTELFFRFNKLMSNTKTGDNQNWHFNKNGKAVISGVQHSFVNGVNISLNYQLWLPDNSNFDKQHHILFNF